MIDKTEIPRDKVPSPTPWVLRQSELESYTLSRKLSPGETASVSAVRGILGQMIQAQENESTDRQHYGRFEVRVYARIVGGGGNFDQVEPVSG